MENNKQVILGKDLWIFVGLNNETKEFKIIPFLFNTNPYKIKDLIDGEVNIKSEEDNNWSPSSIIENKYNVKKYTILNSENQSLFYNNTKISQNKLNKIVDELTNLYKKESYVIKQEKSIIKGRDISWLIGYTYDYKKIVVIPYTINENKNKITVLSDGKEYLKDKRFDFVILKEKYNIYHIDILDYNECDKNNGLPRNIKADNIITRKDIDRTITYLTKAYEKVLPKIKKKDAKETFIREIKEKLKNFEEVIINGKKIIAYSEDIKYLVATDKNNNLQVIPFIKGNDRHKYKILTSGVNFNANNDCWGPKELAEHLNLNLKRTYCLGEVFPKSYSLAGVNGYNLDKLVTREKLNKFINIITNHYITSKKEDSKEIIK